MAARFSDSWKMPWLAAPSPKNDTATRPSPSTRAARAAPTASEMPPPTMALAPRMPRAKSAMCIDPPRPRHRPVDRPYSSAAMGSKSQPLAMQWPWPRWVLVIMSASLRWAHTPAATGSAPW